MDCPFEEAVHRPHTVQTCTNLQRAKLSTKLPRHTAQQHKENYRGKQSTTYAPAQNIRKGDTTIEQGSNFPWELAAMAQQ
eukprot:scaffold308245_cov24-Tisochrysis_lutea.AAC.1